MARARQPEKQERRKGQSAYAALEAFSQKEPVGTGAAPAVAKPPGAAKAEAPAARAQRIAESKPEAKVVETKPAALPPAASTARKELPDVVVVASTPVTDTPVTDTPVTTLPVSSPQAKPEVVESKPAKAAPAKDQKEPLDVTVVTSTPVTTTPISSAPAAPAFAKPEVKTVPLGTHKVPTQSSVAAAKRPGPRALPQPKSVPVSELKVTAASPPAKAEAKLSAPAAKAPTARRRLEDPGQAPPKRIFDWSLLAKIDSLLLGAESSFFLHRRDDGLRLPGYEPENLESSGSEEDEEEACESDESEESDTAKILAAPGPTDADLQDEEEEEFEEEEEEELEEDDVVEEVDKNDAMAAVVATTRPKAKMPPPPPSREVSEPKAPALSTRAKPPPLPRERRPKLGERRDQELEEPPAAAPEVESKAEEEEAAHEEDEDFNDEEMMATFAAKLQEPTEDAAPPLEARRRPVGSRSEQDSDQKPANIATRAKAKPKPKAWGLPPPLSGKKKAKEADAKPPREPDVEAPLPEASPEVEQPPPPFFDQWLASLKFIAGWNDQKKYEASQVKEAFSEYLATEDIVGKTTVEQLCRTIVPLLLDLERVDTMVVANLKTEVLKTLKIVQVCILRIVTFEMLREASAKADAVQKKGPKGKKVQPEVPPEGAAYLASDITSLAKVIQHFRFDQNFSKGVHELIVAFRKQKADKPRQEKGATKAPPPKKRRVEAEATDKAEAPEKVQATEKLQAPEKAPAEAKAPPEAKAPAEEKVPAPEKAPAPEKDTVPDKAQAPENAQAADKDQAPEKAELPENVAREGGEPPPAAEEENADQEGEGDAGGEPARKKPRLVS